MAHHSLARYVSHRNDKIQEIARVMQAFQADPTSATQGEILHLMQKYLNRKVSNSDNPPSEKELLFDIEAFILKEKLNSYNLINEMTSRERRRSQSTSSIPTSHEQSVNELRGVSRRGSNSPDGKNRLFLTIKVNQNSNVWESVKKKVAGTSKSPVEKKSQLWKSLTAKKNKVAALMYL
jgi:hypothetical protein